MNVKKILALIILGTLLVSCSNRKELDLSNVQPPKMEKMEGDYNLDFTAMHNYVIEELQADLTPFFYIVNGSFDISGDNEKKEITVKCKCMDGCVENDVDLFFSMVLNLISYNASEQDYRFKAPSLDNNGTYIDFGTVFNYYDLKLYAEKESGEVLKNLIVTKGYKIPIDSRYIEEN